MVLKKLRKKYSELRSWQKRRAYESSKREEHRLYREARLAPLREQVAASELKIAEAKSKRKKLAPSGGFGGYFAGFKGFDMGDQGYDMFGFPTGKKPAIKKVKKRHRKKKFRDKKNRRPIIIYR